MAVLSTMVVALAATGALGSAIPSRAAAKNFSVNQVHNPHHVRHGPSALLKVYKKYGATVPESLKAAASTSSGSGSATTTPEQYDVCVLSLPAWPSDQVKC